MSYDVLGMRQRGRNIETASAPWGDGWLGNPDRANDAGGTLTRQEASALFADKIAAKAQDANWYNAFQGLRGKRIGYYKPDEEFIHLQALDDWLDANPSNTQQGNVTQQPFRLIIAGGRKFDDYDRLKLEVERRLSDAGIAISPDSLQVVSGMATGADSLGLRWGEEVGVPVAKYPAAWNDISGRKPHEIGTNRYGKPYWKNAGYARNRQMAENADAVIVFPGGNGTEHMARTARELGLPVWDARELSEPMQPAEVIAGAAAELRGVTPQEIADEADAAMQRTEFWGNPWAVPAVGGGAVAAGGAAFWLAAALAAEQEKEQQQLPQQLELL